MPIALRLNVRSRIPSHSEPKGLMEATTETPHSRDGSLARTKTLTPNLTTSQQTDSPKRDCIFLEARISRSSFVHHPDAVPPSQTVAGCPVPMCGCAEMDPFPTHDEVSATQRRAPQYLVIADKTTFTTPQSQLPYIGGITLTSSPELPEEPSPHETRGGDGPEALEDKCWHQGCTRDGHAPSASNSQRLTRLGDEQRMEFPVWCGTGSHEICVDVDYCCFRVCWLQTRPQ